MMGIVRVWILLNIYWWKLLCRVILRWLNGLFRSNVFGWVRRVCSRVMCVCWLLDKVVGFWWKVFLRFECLSVLFMVLCWVFFLSVVGSVSSKFCLILNWLNNSVFWKRMLIWCCVVGRMLICCLLSYSLFV